VPPPTRDRRNGYGAPAHPGALQADHLITQQETDLARIVRFHQIGGAEVLRVEEVEVPPPGKGEGPEPHQGTRAEPRRSDVPQRARAATAARCPAAQPCPQRSTPRRVQGDGCCWGGNTSRPATTTRSWRACYVEWACDARRRDRWRNEQAQQHAGLATGCAARNRQGRRVCCSTWFGLFTPSPVTPAAPTSRRSPEHRGGTRRANLHSCSPPPQARQPGWGTPPRGPRP
jgi:hypothetical protein